MGFKLALHHLIPCVTHLHAEINNPYSWKAKGTLELPSNRLYLHLIWSVWVCWTSPGANEHAWISYASLKTFLLAFRFLLLLPSCHSSPYQKQHLDSCSFTRERKNSPKIKAESHTTESCITCKLQERLQKRAHLHFFLAQTESTGRYSVSEGHYSTPATYSGCNTYQEMIY